MKINFTDKKTWFLLGAVLILMAACAGAFTYLLNISKTPAVELIDFKGMAREEVIQWMDDNKVPADQYSFTYDYDEEASKNTVISQSIPEKGFLEYNLTLSLTLSDGPDPNKEVALPDLTKMTEKEMDEWFKENKFTDVTFEYVQDDKVEKGHIVKINIADTKAKRNAPVLITISIGGETKDTEITLPDFKDYTKTNIQAWAKTNQITVSFVTEASDKIAKDKVIKQNPAAGTKVKTGSKVTVTISSGKATSIVSFIGKKKEDAQKWCNENNVKASFLEYYDENAAENTIFEQSVTTGTVTDGQTITFKIAKGWVPMESFVNKKRNEFDSYIAGINNNYNKSAQIKVNYTEEESDKAAGTILEMSANGKAITGKTSVPPKTTINVKVAKEKTIAVESKVNKLNETDFRKYIEGLGLKPNKTGDKYNDSAAAGNVASHDTGNFKSGSTINYVISKGKYNLDQNLCKPGNDFNTLNNTIANANKDGAGWTIASSQEQSETYEKGKIISCTVNNKSVTCKVSSGKVEYVYVPDVTNKSLTDAQTALSNAGLSTGNPIYTYSDDVENGYVIAQSISKDQKVLKGTTITLTVSKGKEMHCPVNTTGSYPNCTPDNGYTYNAETNTTEKIMQTLQFNSAVVSGGTYAEMEANCRAILGGFQNITFNKKIGEDANPDSKKAAILVSPENGSSTWILDPIVIDIFCTE